MQRNLVQAGLCTEVFQSRDTFSRFVYKFHNTVNVQLGKPVWTTPYEQLRDNMECVRARCSNNQPAPVAAVAKESGCTEPVVLGFALRTGPIQLTKRDNPDSIVCTLHS